MSCVCTECQVTICMHAGNLDNGLTCSMTVCIAQQHCLFKHLGISVIESSLKLMDYLTLSLQ